MYKHNRIKLLSDAEIETLYARPTFNETEQALYFEFSNHELIVARKYRTVKAQLCFMLSLGYFKAKQQFYRFNPSVESVDATRYIINKFFAAKNIVPMSGVLDFKTYKKQKEEILAMTGYHDWSSQCRNHIEQRISDLLRYHPKPHNALRELMNYFEKQRIVIPSYRQLQDMFTTAISNEEKRFNKIMATIPTHCQNKLSELIKNVDGITALNTIRSDQKDFQYTALRAEVNKVCELSDLYYFSKQIIPTFKLSKNAVRYYADVAAQYPASRLRKLNKTLQWLYTLCFVYHRYQQLLDNLIISFIYHVRAIMDAGKTYADVALMKYSASLVVDFPKLAQFLEWFPKRQPGMSYDELNKTAYGILPEEQFPALAKFLSGNTFDKKAAKWEFFAKSSRMLSLYLRPIIMAVPFVHYKNDSKLMEMIGLLKGHYSSGKHPADFRLNDSLGITVPKSMERYLKRNATDKQIDPYLFEFYVCQKMYHQLDRGMLYCNESISYCDIDQDLVDDAMVDDAKKIAAEFGYAKIPVYCDSRLDEVLVALDTAWHTTTENIRLGNNAGFNLKEIKEGQEQEWSLLYDTSEKLDDTFFKTLPKTEIADIMIFIGDHFDMWTGFEHMKDRYLKRAHPAKLPINACILSEAFGFSESKMAEMSDISMNLLRSTTEDFICVDTLCATNDIVCDEINALPIFKLWNLMDEKLLADADGQKFRTSDNTIQSRYSKKFLGKGRGISLYTLIANFIAANAKNLGLNEYEGHSLFDMIYGNKTDIEINMVTGDNHSLNQLNAVALDVIDVEFLPSVKNIKEAASNLYSVQPPDTYKDDILQSKGIINVERIRSQKRGVLRVLLSLVVQENTQTNIIRKLNSHARYARLKAALFEYNKIFISTHVLNMINDMQLRKALRSARNRTEAYHQLQGFIRKIYSGIFKGKKIVDNRVSAHAVRLVANCIIAYNSIILNTIYEKMLKDGVAQEIIDEFARVSPIAWIHILFEGRYSFTKSNGEIDIAAMVSALEAHLRQSLWKKVA